MQREKQMNKTQTTRQSTAQLGSAQTRSAQQPQGTTLRGPTGGKCVRLPVAGCWACQPPTNLGPNSGLSPHFLVIKHSSFNRAHGSFLESATHRSLRKVSEFSTSTFACQPGPQSHLLSIALHPVKFADSEENHYSHGASRHPELSPRLYNM